MTKLPFTSFKALTTALLSRFALSEAQVSARQTALQTLVWESGSKLSLYNDKFLSASERTELPDKQIRDIYVKSLGDELARMVISQ